MPSLSVLALGALLGAPTADAKPVKLVTSSAMSSHTDDSGINYSAKNLRDGKVSTVWVEGEDGSGLGSWVQVDLDGPKSVQSIRIWNGNWYTTDFWERHNRAKEIELEFSDGTTQTVTLADEMKPELIKLDKAVQTSFVKIKIKGIYRGNTFNDTCISEIQVLDGSPEEYVVPASAKASSVYPADADGNYEPANTWDLLLDSMWCEASKEGDGVGEWIEYDFGGPRQVSKLHLNNGNAYSFAFNMKANRAKAAQLTFSDGSSAMVTLKSSGMNQVVEFPSVTTSSVRITFKEVVAGKEYNDLCISEARFLP